VFVGRQGQGDLRGPADSAAAAGRVRVASLGHSCILRLQSRLCGSGLRPAGGANRMIVVTVTVYRP
jgi:hypothetical protein